VPGGARHLGGRAGPGRSADFRERRHCAGDQRDDDSRAGPKVLVISGRPPYASLVRLAQRDELPRFPFLDELAAPLPHTILCCSRATRRLARNSFNRC
jgi:hypothetical protein